MANFFDDPMESVGLDSSNPVDYTPIGLATDPILNATGNKTTGNLIDAATGDAPTESLTSPEYSVEAPNYDEFYARMNASLDKQNELAQQQIDIAKRQADMAEQQFSFYKENFLPVITDLIGKADRGIDTDYASVLAAQRTDAGMKTMAGAAGRDLQRLGVNRQDELYAGLDQQSEEARKFATTGSKNVARMEAVDASDRRRMEVAGMASGVPTLGTSALTSTANTLAGAAATGMNAQAGLNAVQQQQANAQFNQTTLANQNVYANAQFQADASFANTMAQAQAMNSLFQGAGTLGGAYLTSQAMQREPTGGYTTPSISSPQSPRSGGDYVLSGGYNPPPVKMTDGGGIWGNGPGF